MKPYGVSFEAWGKCENVNCSTIGKIALIKLQNLWTPAGSLSLKEQSLATPPRRRSAGHGQKIGEAFPLGKFEDPWAPNSAAHPGELRHGRHKNHVSIPKLYVPPAIPGEHQVIGIKAGDSFPASLYLNVPKASHLREPTGGEKGMGHPG